MEGPIFGGAYVRREICVIKSVGLDCSGEEIYHFCFVLLCIRGQIPSTSPPGGLYLEGRFKGAFFALRFGGAYRIYSNKRPASNQRPPRISAHPKGRKS